MRTETKITLDGKECRQLIAKALSIPVENVVSLKYNFGVVGYSESEISEKLKQAGIS